MARQVDTFRQSRSIIWKFNLLNKKPCFYGIQLCVVLDRRASRWLENPALSFCTSSSHALSLISEPLDCMKRWHVSTNRFFFKSSGYVRSLITKTVDSMKIESSTKILFSRSSGYVLVLITCPERLKSFLGFLTLRQSRWNSSSGRWGSCFRSWDSDLTVWDSHFGGWGTHFWKEWSPFLGTPIAVSGPRC